MVLSLPVLSPCAVEGRAETHHGSGRARLRSSVTFLTLILTSLDWAKSDQSTRLPMALTMAMVAKIRVDRPGA